MKKILITIAVIAILFIHPLAFADVLPNYTKSIDVCATITNMDDHSEVTLLFFTSYENSVNPPSPDEPNPPKLVKNGDCVENEGNMYYSKSVYVVSSTYWKTQLSNTKYDPSKDQNAYKLDFGSEPPMSDLVEENSPLTRVKYYYAIERIIMKGDKKVLLLSLIKKETNLGTTDYSSIFTDVERGSTYYDALLYLKHLNIISGYPDGSFKPDNTINRAEFTKIIVGAIHDPHDYGLCMENYAKPDGSYADMFTDVITASQAWYLNYICAAISDHLIKGYPDGSFKPGRNINFAEAAKIIAIGFNLTSSTSASTPWYKVYVDALSAKNAVPVSVATPDQNITRGEMAEMIFRIKKLEIQNELFNLTPL